MTEAVQHCPLCGSTENKAFDQRIFRGYQVINKICANCGLVYQSPRMTTAELNAFYESEYRTLYQGSEGPGRKDLVIQRGRAEALLYFVRGNIPVPRRHLDIGASAGSLALRFEEYFNCTSYGVEPGLAYRQYAEARGLTVYPTLEAAQEKAPFDLISMAHVLEHIPDPVDYLDRIRRDFLAPKGWLLVEVPNLYAHNSFEVAHLVAFSPHTLLETIKKAGFTIHALRRHGQPRSVVLPLYLTILAQPHPAPPGSGRYPVRAERGVALKRRGGMARRRLLQRLLPNLAWLPMG